MPAGPVALTSSARVPSKPGDFPVLNLFFFLQHAQLLIGVVVVHVYLRDLFFNQWLFLFCPFKQLSTIFLPSVQDIFLLFQNNSVFVFYNVHACCDGLVLSFFTDFIISYIFSDLPITFSYLLALVFKANRLLIP